MDEPRDPMDLALDLCERQHGVVGRHQLVRVLGRGPAEHLLLRTGRFSPIRRGIWRVRGGPTLPSQSAFAAALRARPEAVVSGPVALGLLGVPGFVGAEDFEILTTVQRRLTNVDFPHRVDPVPRRGLARYGEVRVAGPLDALIDSATFLEGRTERDLRVAWDHLRWQGLAKTDRLARRLEQLRETEGAGVLQRILEVGGGLAVESEGERRLAPVMSCFEPALEPQVWVTTRRRVDFFSRRCRYGYEYLGALDHAGVAQRLADDERDEELRREGIRLGYVTAADLLDLPALVATIAGTLTVRAHELGVRPPVALRSPVTA